MRLLISLDDVPAMFSFNHVFWLRCPGGVNGLLQAVLWYYSTDFRERPHSISQYIADMIELQDSQDVIDGASFSDDDINLSSDLAAHIEPLIETISAVLDSYIPDVNLRRIKSFSLKTDGHLLVEI